MDIPPSHSDDSFCCIGCRAVHGLIADAGLDRYYTLGGGQGQPIGRVPEPGRHTWLAEALQIQPGEPPHARVRLDVQGIHCAACVWLLRQLFERYDGALHIAINPSVGSLDLAFDPARMRIESFLDEVERLGYRLAPARKHSSSEDRRLLVRMGICIALALNSMMFAFATYFGMSAADTAHGMFHWLAFGLAAVAVVVGGPVFFQRAFAGLRRRVLHLDLPISLGILLAFAGSSYQFLVAGGAGYFDTVTVFVALMLVGRYLQQRSIRRNRDFLLANTGTEHLRVRRQDPTGLSTIAIDQIHKGDTLLLVPGDLVPTKVRVGDRAGLFSLDWINGEAEPSTITPGEIAPAGAFLRSTHGVRVEALEDAADSELLQLLATPGGDRDDRAESPFWTWLNRAYVWLVLSLATTACLTWLYIDPSRALEITVSVLVVTCPCALGLATPLAFDMVLAQLRRRGVYVRTTSLLDRARRIRTILFDKTGTLTWGDLKAVVLRPVPEEFRDVLLSMASSSNHPVSRAIVDSASTAKFRYLDQMQVEDEPGRGLRAFYQGHHYRLGAQSYVFAEPDDDGDGRACYFSRDGHIEACYRIEEHLRPGFHHEVERLTQLGQQIYILSGDCRQRVATVAKRLGIAPERAHAELSPQAKARLVEQLDHRDTLMLGDGLNDAPAFEAAWCAGAAGLDRPAMPSRADFFFLGEGSSTVRGILLAARRLHQVVVTNLWLAAFYNLIALTLCFCGWMSPLLCAVLMPASSLLLVWHTVARLRQPLPENTPR